MRNFFTSVFHRTSESLHTFALRIRKLFARSQ